MTISSSYLSSVLLRPLAEAQNSIATASVEASTGQYADLGLQLGDGAGLEMSLRNQSAQLQSYSDANQIVSTRMGAAQTALDSVRTGAQSVLKSIASLANGSNALAMLGAVGSGALQDLTSAANVNAAGQYVFAGENSSTPPLGDFFASSGSPAKTAIESAFQSTFGFAIGSPQASTISVSALQQFLNGPFAGLFQGSNWSADWSSASASGATVDIGPGQSATSTTTANSPVFQQLAQAYAMLSEFGGAALSKDAQNLVAQTATTLVSKGLASATAEQAGLGVVQQRVDNASQGVSAQQKIIQQQLNAMVSVDMNSVATRISALTTQIQTSYALTARLQQLNLAHYL